MILSHPPVHIRGLGSLPGSWTPTQPDYSPKEAPKRDPPAPKPKPPRYFASPVKPRPSVDTGLVEVRPASSGGSGLFAAKRIHRGTRILAEHPVISMPISERPGADRDPTAFCNEIRQLSQEKLKEFDQLYCNPEHMNGETRARVRQWYRDQGITNANGETLKGKKLQDTAKPMVKRFAIFLTNRISMSATEGEESSGPTVGVFPLFSRINHSCVPNVHNQYNPTLRRLTLHACRDIEAGEQIFVSYVEYACRTRQQRASELAYWGFVCDCSACLDPAVDILRRRSFELDQGLAVYSNALIRKMGNAMLPSILPYVPTSPSEALKFAEELVRLQERQGITGMALCKTYRDCSNYSRAVGDFTKALDYAHKELDLERCIIGTEVDYLRKDMQDAYSWKKSLEKERFRNLRQFWERGRFS